MTTQSKTAKPWLNDDITAASIDQFLADPCEFFGNSLTNLMSLARKPRERLQLASLKRRFSQFRGSLPMLDKLADSQNINAIEQLEDVTPLLFGHSVYKSYPPSLLDKHRYDQLTVWLNKLTTIDLSHVDVSACRSIDDWMLTLKRETPLFVCHTSGTSGTMSFLPWDSAECDKFIGGYPITQFQHFGQDGPIETRPVNIDCIYPYFRSGGISHAVLNDFVIKHIAGSEERFHAAYPGRLSADMMLLASRYRAAAAKGQLDRLQISPELAARRAEFEIQQRDMPRRAAEFFDTMRTTLAGRRVFIQCANPMLTKLAEDGLKQGLKKIFAPDSLIVTGGGGKGTVLPGNWREMVKEFFGCDNINNNYGMTEGGGFNRSCEHGNYHILPGTIPFILDPDTFKPLPRTGRATGCYAFYDLLPDTHWGGFITGDYLTMEFDAPCACGRNAPYIVGEVKRLSEVRNVEGEEKLSCAAAPGAYADALDYLNEGTA
ncbi:MAG: hypothetical protein PHQ05_01410 [Sterolibacterium sp.]|nr:hypothetical protein [Sterolibacterium sp.]